MLYMFMHSKLFVFFTHQVSDASILKKISFGDGGYHDVVHLGKIALYSETYGEKLSCDQIACTITYPSRASLNYSNRTSLL